MTTLLACLASISVVNPTPSSSSSMFKKSPSITSIGSQLIPSFSSNSLNNIPSPSRSTTSIHKDNGKDSSNSGNAVSTSAYKMGVQIFEIFSSLCTASAQGYDTVITVISEVKGEQYRFERLIQSLHNLGGTTNQGFYLNHDKKHTSKLSSLIEEQQEILVYDCLTAALNLFNNIVQIPKKTETRDSLRNELERRGFEELVHRLEQKKDSLPDALEKQVTLYFQKKRADQDQIRASQQTKRQSILQL